MNLRFGLLWPFRNPEFAKVPWNDLYRSHLDLISDSEAMGYDDAWLTEHHFVDDGYSPSLMSIAGAISQRTRRIRIGTFLVLLPLHNPVRLAEDVATVDLMSDGRVDLGVGLGYRPKEFDDQGIASASRGRRLKEGVEILQRLLSDELVTYDGKYNHLKEIQIVPPAVQRPHPPIWIGAIAPKAIERAAKMGMHFQCTAPVESVKYYDECLEAAGRNPSDFSVAQLRWVHVAKSRDEAWENCAKALHYTNTCYSKWFAEANDSPGDDQGLDDIKSVEEIIRTQHFDFFGEDSIVGTPSDVRDMIADYQSRGRMTHLVMGMAMSGLAPHLIRNSMDLFAKDVMPHFKK